MILFIALPDPQDKSAFELNAFPLALLPRGCPHCGCDAIIAHGQRRRRTDITVWIAGERLGNRVAMVAALGNKLLRSAKIPIDYPIQPRCGVGPVADC